MGTKSEEHNMEDTTEGTGLRRQQEDIFYVGEKKNKSAHVSLPRNIQDERTFEVVALVVLIYY